MKPIREATAKFETWLEEHTAIVEAHLDYKHEQMTADPFMFFRATFYRWAQQWVECCPKLAELKHVLSVGDLHIENFGTWRDREGRLAWGVNDFDEAFPMAWPNDLVRLAASVILAREGQHVDIRTDDACKAIETGYVEAMKTGGCPFVLEEQHEHLREMALNALREPADFWERLAARVIPASKVPAAVAKAIVWSLPGGANPQYKIVITPKGLGSLGQQRFLAFADWKGSRLAREAKSLRPSACRWAWKEEGKCKILCEAIRARAVHCPDPLLIFHKRWLVRRLGPYCRRIEMERVQTHRNIFDLLRAMGRETANIHLGTPKAAKRVLREAKSLPTHWLRDAAQTMVDALHADWKDWRKSA